MTHSNTLGIAAGAVDIRGFHNGDIVLLGPLFRLRLPQFIIVFNGGNICAAIRTDKPAISYLLFQYYLTPCFPLSASREGEVLGKRGCAPLKRPVSKSLSLSLFQRETMSFFLYFLFCSLLLSLFRKEGLREILY
jgi:hypothetical protein